MLNPNEVYTVAVTILGSGAFAHALNRIFGPKAVTVEKQAVEVAKEAKPFVIEGIHAVEDLLKLPELAGVKERVGHLETELRNSKIDAVVRGLATAYGKTLGELTDDEKAVLVLYAQTELAKLGYTVTPEEISDVILTSRQLADTFSGSEAYKQTAQTVAIKRQLAEETRKALSPTDNGQAAQPAVS